MKPLIQLQIPELGFLKNIQSDVSETAQIQAKTNTARAMAKMLAEKAGGAHLENGLVEYFLGNSEDVLEHLDKAPLEILDKIAFCKDEFTLFLGLSLNAKEGFRGLGQEEGRLRGEGQTYTLAMPQDQALNNFLEVLVKTECVDAAQDASDIYRHHCQASQAELRSQMRERLLATESYDDFVDLFMQESCNSLFITKPEKSFRKAGTYFADHKHIQKEDIKPEKALSDLFTKRIQKTATDLGVAIDQPVHSLKLLAKMPLFVSSVAAQVECELQVEVEQETEAQVETELQLEHTTEREQEETKERAKADIFFPPRLTPDKPVVAPVNIHIHKAYSPKLFVTEAFLPIERNKTGSKFKREAFELSTFNTGEIFFDFEKDAIKSVTIEDPLRDENLTSSVIYDINLGEVVQKGYNLYTRLTFDQLIDTPEFHSYIAQIKFLNGNTSGYKEKELKALAAWLETNDPIEMKRHMLEEVFFYRYRDRELFESSQLGTLFRQLNPVK